MDKAQELEVVKTAYFLEDRIAKLKAEGRQLDSEKPQKPSAPEEPEEWSTKVNPIPYPAINPPPVVLPPFWKRGVIILCVSFAVMILSFVLVFIVPSLTFVLIALSVLGMMAGGILLLVDALNASAKKKSITQQLTEQIRNSPEYQMQCRQIDKQNQMRQAQLDKENHEKYLQRYEQYKAAHQEYEIELKDYEEQQLPEWSEEVDELKNIISYTNNALQEVYSKNVIPIQYCNIPALTYLTMFLSTSDFDLKYAIERYDAYVSQTAQREQIDIARAQLRVQKETLHNQQYTNWLNEQIVSLAEEGNSTLQSIDNWQKADIAVREYRRHKARKEAKKALK